MGASMTCTHHWMVPTPDGRHRLPSRCRDCFATKSFAPALEYMDIAPREFNAPISVDDPEDRTGSMATAPPWMRWGKRDDQEREQS